MAPTFRTISRALLSLSVSCLVAASSARTASAQVINDPPAAPVSIVAFPSNEAIESTVQVGDIIDILLIRNGVTISSILGVTPVGGNLLVNGVAGAACWGPVTPDMRPGDIVRYVSHLPDGTVRSIDQIHVRPLTVGPAAEIAPGVIEIHGTASDLNGLPIPLPNVDQRVIGSGIFAKNGRKTLRAGAANTDGTFSYDTVNNPTGINWTVRYSGLVPSDVAMALAGEIRVRWLGANPAIFNDVTIYANAANVVPGPFAGTCTAPLEPLDVTAPTAPASFASTVTGPDSRSYSWLGSTDDVAVAGYEVRRDGVTIARLGPLATTFSETAIPAGSHTYTAVAFDNASPLGAGATPSAQIKAGFGQLWGNRSAASNAVAFVQDDVIPPTTPATFTVAKGNGKAMPSWSLATDNVGVVSYGVYRDNVLIVTLPSPTTTYKDSGLVTGTYTYSVDAVDAAGLRSARTANVAVNVVFIPDTTPPTVPGAAAAIVSPDVHGRTAVVTWNAATDSMGVTGYRLFRNGVQRALLGPNTLSFSDSALATATYVYRVDAFDAANNHSLLSAGVTAVIANDPPLAAHALLAQPSRDEVSATGYPAAQGPYVFNVIRGATTFTSAPINADGTGLVQVNGAGGGCWNGTTPDIRAGDVIRITDAAGIAEQTTIANITTQFAIPTTGTSVVVHGTARDAAGNPLPLGQIEHQLIATTGVFDKNATAMLRASASAGTDGTLAYDALGSTHWTATYTGLSAADVARACGGPSTVAAESRGLWLGRTPADGTELSTFETGFFVNGGPAAGTCVTPAESPVAVAAFVPVSLGFPDVAAIPAATSNVQTVEVDNNGAAPMTVFAVYIAGANASDFTLTGPAAPSTVAPGGFFTVQLTFSPKALGARMARLCVSCDAAGTTALTVPLSGTGTTDTTPPTVPTGVVASVGPDVHGRDVTVSWNAATDSVGVTGYTVTRDGIAIATTGAATLTYHDASVAPAPHVYRVDAFDLQANHSAASAGASVVVASEPPAAGHVLSAHPSRDWVSGSGYPAANGPYVFTVFRLNGNKLFTSAPATADGSGFVQVNAAGGVCWNVTTPDLRAGDVVRITDAAGFADQTTVADVTAELPVAVDSATIVVHGTAQDAGNAPLPMDQLQHQLIAASGLFDNNGTATLRASAAAGADGLLAYDSPGSTHWTATYSNLSAADVARATGGTDTPAGTIAGAESQGVWLGRSPLAGTERTLSETGPGVMGGPFAAQCAAPAESPAAVAAFLPSAIQFDRQGVSPSTTSAPRAILFRNSGDAPMRIRGARITGLNAADFSIVSSDAPAVLAPNTFCTVSVAFAPSALGSRQAAVSLSCDAANTPALSVPLMGAGWSGLVIADPSGPRQSIGVGARIAPLPDGGTGQRTLPVSLSWDASPSIQVSHYDLQQSVNGGPFVDAPVQPGAALGVTLALPLAPAGAPTQYRFRVRAASAGETSGWVTGSEFGLEPVDDSNANRLIYTGSWNTGSMAGAWGGSIHNTSNKCGVELRASAPFTISGSIAWITSMGPDRGKVSVRVDDKDSVIVDLYSDTSRVAAVGYVATNLAAGRTHRMVVHALARKNNLSTAARVDMDAFIVVNAVSRSGPVVVNHTPEALLAQLPDPPASLSFSRIAPNPVMGRATLTFGLPRDGVVRIDVMDVQGRLVQQLANGVLPAGEHRITWDGHSGAASAAHSGVYFAVLRFGEQTLVRRMIWMP